MDANVGDVVLPGDLLTITNSDNRRKAILGPGLRLNLDQVLITTCGVLRKKDPNIYWVDCYRKRYIPAKGDTVVGVVVNKSGDIFKVDIGTSEQASLSYLAFEGATKKNRPDVQVGDIVFAKLLMAVRDMEPELVCVDSYGKKGKFGILPEDGFIFSCSLNLTRKVLNPECRLLKILGKEIPHDIAIGMNGKIWVKARSVKATIAIGNAILAAELLTDEEMIAMCDSVINSVVGMQD
ncbi:exosome complex component RRP40 [Periplaneta americana]|uniref:exosome complex component RRP40 n=1 Tax=Periplaneta americana TaxID=6978 RepID=UPI0037E9AE24